MSDYWNTDHLVPATTLGGKIGEWVCALLGLAAMVGVLGVAGYWIWAWVAAIF